VVGILNTVVETTAHVLARRAEAERVQAAAEHQAERIDLLEEVFHHSPAFLHVLSGPTFVVEMANEAYYALVGRRDLLGRPAFEAMPEAAAGGFPERLARVMTTGEPFIGRELPVTLARTPGAPPEERLIDLVYLPLVDAEGRHTRILGHGVDVTEHVRERQAVETALAERTAAAEAANRAKTDFLAVMSHELRTPLNAIGGYAQLMELGLHGPVTPEQLAALARIQRGQQHLLGLINSVLNYAKLEAGHVAYATADVPVGTALAEVAALIAPQAHAKGLTLTVEPCAPTLTARADPEKVRQVLLNLLSNAVKFSDRGEKITTGCGAATDGYLALRVSDTGRGIPADQLKRVFQPFVQIDAQLTRTEEGTGLGLAISHDLARGMGGTLTAESTPGVGSTFTLMLPAAG
jgi:signal transduction histidine kinase